MSGIKNTLTRAAVYAWRRFAPTAAVLPGISVDELALFEYVRPFTMTSPERVVALANAVRYVVSNNIPGSIVECGVWKGGSMMAIAKTLIAMGVTDRKLYLYDTFAGMTAPTADDGSDFHRQSPQEIFEQTKQSDGTSGWCYSSLEETRKNVLGEGYPQDQIQFIKGPVEQTIPQHIPEQIALLRLDTDFYESSRHEMLHLYPRLSPGGVLLLDDYGHWKGQRKAVDEYLAAHKVPLLLNRIDYTGRIGVKVR